MHEATTKDDFEARFSGRLGAFGRSLDLLIANEWRGVHIGELVGSELTPFGVLDGLQFRSKDPRFPSVRTRPATLARAPLSRSQGHAASSRAHRSETSGGPASLNRISASLSGLLPGLSAQRGSA
jgi:HWE histidine kinase